jgi:hypothetical protein
VIPYHDIMNLEHRYAKRLINLNHRVPGNVAGAPELGPTYCWPFSCLETSRIVRCLPEAPQAKLALRLYPNLVDAPQSTLSMPSHPV